MRMSSCSASGFGFGTSRGTSGWRGFSRTMARMSIHNLPPSCHAGRHRLPHFGVAAGPGLIFMMHVRAAQKRHFIKNMLLEPFKPQINHRRYKKRDHLGEDQAADDDKAKRTSRRGIVAESERKRHRAHKSGKGSHDDRTKALEAGCTNSLSQT